MIEDWDKEIEVVNNKTVFKILFLKIWLICIHFFRIIKIIIIIIPSYLTYINHSVSKNFVDTSECLYKYINVWIQIILRIKISCLNHNFNIDEFISLNLLFLNFNKFFEDSFKY